MFVLERLIVLKKIGATIDSAFKHLPLTDRQRHWLRGFVTATVGAGLAGSLHFTGPDGHFSFRVAGAVLLLCLHHYAQETPIPDLSVTEQEIVDKLTQAANPKQG